jgi:Flp pilus assembly pilin Flp
MQRPLALFLHEESAATAIEYGLIASLLVVMCLAAFTLFGRAVSDMFVFVETQITGAGS